MKFRKHFVIPDPQVKADVPIDHLKAAGNYAAEKRPNVIVVLGDWWDMPSLSSYDSDAKKVKAKRQYASSDEAEGDIDAGRRAMEAFLKPIRKLRRTYSPTLHFCLGNHEARISRFAEEYPYLGGAVSMRHLGLAEAGFKVHPFLKPHVIDGVAYCHYFNVSANGRVLTSKGGQTSARSQVQNIGMSAVAGHKQGLDTYIRECPAGRMRGVIAGSFYQHAEEYLGPQGNSHWQGCLIFHEVHRGNFDLMELSLDYLLRRYA